MYHRFEENKYPSTNIRLKDFKNHIKIIKNEKINFVNPSNFEKSLISSKSSRKILLTIDDGYLSFYKNAWPILKKEKIPFILFISTKEVGNNNYMDWDQIREISRSKIVEIGNHSHTHEYLVDLKKEDIRADMNKSIEIFKKELGKNSIFFSYPFGEYSIEFKNLIKELGFKYAFGQHSGVIDETKDFFELARFPINEKYGEQKRFKSILKSLPFKYKKILPEEKYINSDSNPPIVTVELINKNEKIKSITCYSNEENIWRKSELTFKNDNQIMINLQGKFTTERGRINCSQQEPGGFWRWFGIQFVIAEK